MKKLGDIGVGTKLITGFLVVAAIATMIGVIGIININKVAKAGDIILDEQVPLADASMESMIAVISGRDVMGEFLLTEDVKEFDELQNEYLKTIKDFDANAGYLEQNGDSKVVSLVEEAQGYHTKFEENANLLIEHQRSHVAHEMIKQQLMEDFDQHAADQKVQMVAK